MVHHTRRHHSLVNVKHFLKAFQTHDHHGHGHLDRHSAHKLFNHFADHHGHHLNATDFQNEFHHFAKHHEHEVIDFKGKNFVTNFEIEKIIQML